MITRFVAALDMQPMQIRCIGKTHARSADGEPEKKKAGRSKNNDNQPMEA